MAHLDQFAKEHISYELGELLAQTRVLFVRHSSGLKESTDNALLEAVLVHLRLLDRFFRGVDEISAQSWLPSWTPTKVLTDEQRRRINQQVAHLSPKRELGYQWNPVAMATAACNVFRQFLDALESEHRERAEAFLRCRELTEAWFAQAPLARHPASTSPSLSFSTATATIWQP